MKTSRILLTALFFSAVAPGQAAQPKLVLAIIVDQLRYDYLERFHDQFPPGGFRLLTDDGAFLTFAHYNHVPTTTGAGHATALSGAPPSVHGIISNDWFDKRTLKMTNCVNDPDVEGVGGEANEGRRSPRNFIGSNFADELRLRHQSKVVGISLKDRGAILPAGKKPAGAYWFDSGMGNFMTSTYYMPELPAWVRAFNERKLPASYIGQTWKRLLDPKAYEWPDNAAGEGMMAREKAPVFDHVVHPSPLEGYETIVPTPFGNTLLAEFAKAAIEGENLGSGTRPDLLAVSFSAIDAAGHRFGPYSQEIQDMMLRLDRDLAALFAWIDRRIGLANVAIALTADHGVAPNPEFAREQGLDGQRTDVLKFMGGLLMALEQRFGPGPILLTPRMVDGHLYFNHEALAEQKLSAEDVGWFIRDWALDTGNVQAVFTRWQLLDGRAPGLIGRRVQEGYHAERGGDVVIVSKPFAIATAGKSGTTHGAPYSYDSHVPVAFYGSAFKPGRYADDFSVTDLVPTLCAALRMNEPSGCTGRPLTRILADDGVKQGK